MATGFLGQGGSFSGSTVGSFAGAVTDILGAQSTAAGLKIKAKGDLAEAGNYDLAAQYARQNAQFTEQATAVKEAQTQRQIYLGLGQTTADVTGAGLSLSGSALDLLRDSAQQGALTKAIIQQQGLITEAGYNEQAQSYENMASAARWASSQETKQASVALRNGWINTGLKVATGIASMA